MSTNWGVVATAATGALEDGGNLEHIYMTLATSQNMLLREILIELRVTNQLLQAGLNTADDADTLRQDIESDNMLSSILDG